MVHFGDSEGTIFIFAILELVFKPFLKQSVFVMFFASLVLLKKVWSYYLM